MNGARNTSGAVYMKSASRNAKTTMIGSASKRCIQDVPERSAIALSLPLQGDEVFRQFRHRHVLGVDLRNHASPIEHDEPVGPPVHVLDIEFAIDARPPGLLDLAHENHDLA